MSACCDEIVLERDWLLDEAEQPRTLAGIPAGKADSARQAALMRLQLWTTGETHRILAGFSRAAGDIIRRFESFDTTAMYQAQKAILREWDKAFVETWLPTFKTLRREATSLPFGALAVMHERLAAGRRETVESIAPPVLDTQLAAIIQAANQRIYADGLTLSSRVWRLDKEAREGIQQTLMDGLVNQRSAWQIAKNLEQFLGANQDCPRWTSTRLNKLTKKDIASGDRRGLITGSACDGQGVAYKALRLARTEIQAVHGLATDQVMAAQPWVQAEQVMLSPGHPKSDICDDAAGLGPQPVGTTRLPLHPNCLCYKVAVMQPEEAFIERLHSWTAGGADPGMDTYSAFIGTRRDTLASTSLIDNLIAQALVVWLWGSEKDILEWLL